MPNRKSEKDVHSHEMNELMERVPAWIVRRGIVGISISLGLIILFCSFFSYNEIVKAKIILTTTSPPVNVQSHATGRLINIFTSDGKRVGAGDVLAVVDNTSNYSDVQTLKKRLTEFTTDNRQSLESFSKTFPSNLILGSIQPTYAQFISSFRNLEIYQSLETNKKENLALEEQIKQQKALLKIQESQRTTYKEQFELAKKLFARNQTLHQEKVISESDFEASSKQFLAEKQVLTGFESSISNTKISISVLESQRVKSLNTDVELLWSLKLRLEESLQNLKNSISAWEHEYLIISPAHGSLTLFDVWSENQIVKNGDIVFAVIPDTASEIIGKLYIPIQNSGKIKAGQTVIIKLDNFPFQEWGSLEGKITSIASVPKFGEQNYMAYVKLKNLNTSFNRTMPFKQEMSGSAEIITEELSILNRILFHVRKVTAR